MAVQSDSSEQPGPGLLSAAPEEGGGGDDDGGGREVKNENRAQMELYDNLINDIIGVNNELKPEKDKCSSNDTSPTTAVPDEADPSKSPLSDMSKGSTSGRKPMLIGNLTWWTTADDLLSAIHSTGILDVGEIKFYEVAKGGQSRGFVSVNLFSHCDTRRLLKVLPKKEVHGRRLVVRYFTSPNYWYFESQFQRAMEKSKLHLTKNHVFTPGITMNTLEEDDGAPIPVQIQQRITAPKNQASRTTFPPFPPPPFPPPSFTAAGSTPFSPNSLLPDLTSLAVPRTNITPQVLGAFPNLFLQYLTSLIVPPLNIPGQVACTIPNLSLPNLTSLPVPPLNIPAPGLSGLGQSQMAQLAGVDPMTFITQSTSLPGRETSIQEILQSNKELERLFSTDQNRDGSEDYGTLLRLVSFIKKSKPTVQGGFEDSNCSPDRSHRRQSSFRNSSYSPDRSHRGGTSFRDSNWSPDRSHRGESSFRDSNWSPDRSHRGESSFRDSNWSPDRSHRGESSFRDSNWSPDRSHRGESSFRDSSYSLDRSHREESKRSGLREREYSRRRENRRSEERSGSLRDRSRSPSSCNSYYQRERMDYDQHRQQSDFEKSSRMDYYMDRSRNFDRERSCESRRYQSRNSDPWHTNSEKSEKGHSYSEEKYRIKQRKDREYHF
ncbi:cleavage and polyadenylation specificity factor subunit 7-like [Scyliorhinus canicula]|uniref:cleavage and polyadenylation specificity factor subunit 7-like n=1 Tax=Scyliorhinus canicula TaxID=7830 RepID=UPI0018F3B772|nr:cleavage and polyadenylation specificity factor subunit 7-like [Scyliorhinus canicula]